MAADNQGSITLKFGNIFAISLYFDQQHNPNKYFAKIAKKGGTIQDG
jgi:uncharacterized glyoxalase superfamily protein PhnB